MVFGRYQAKIKSISGVYKKEIKNDPSFEKAKLMANQFAEIERPNECEVEYLDFDGKLRQEILNYLLMR